MIKYCKQCGKAFVYTRKYRNYCSRKCSLFRPSFYKICLWCKKEFIFTKEKKFYCSSDCLNDYLKKKKKILQAKNKFFKIMKETKEKGIKIKIISSEKVGKKCTCGMIFFAKRKKFCSKKCLNRNTYRKNKLSKCMSSSINQTLKNGEKNKRKWEKLVGYSLKKLRFRLKKTIPQKYNWQDFIDGKLQIDHIIPIKLYSYKTAEDIHFKKCWNLRNLRFLERNKNIRKSGKINLLLVEQYDIKDLLP